MWPVIVHLGPVPIYSFGVMAALAFLVGSHLLKLEMQRRGYPEPTWSSFAVWALAGGFLGAKLNYLLTHLVDLQADPRGMIFSGSGLVWYGGFLGGILAVWLAGRREQIPFLTLADAFAPALAAAYTLGRVGCFVSGDGDYGRACSLPWAMAFPNGMVPTTERVHPTPLYEILMTLPILLTLWSTRSKGWIPGRQFGLYMALSGTERFVVEFFRRNAPGFLGLTTAQHLSFVAILVGIALIMRRTPAGMSTPVRVQG